MQHSQVGFNIYIIYDFNAVDGQLYTFGSNDHGQLGREASSQFLILSDVI